MNKMIALLKRNNRLEIIGLIVGIIGTVWAVYTYYNPAEQKVVHSIDMEQVDQVKEGVKSAVKSTTTAISETTSDAADSIAETTSKGWNALKEKASTIKNNLTTKEDK